MGKKAKIIKKGNANFKNLKNGKAKLEPIKIPNSKPSKYDDYKDEILALWDTHQFENKKILAVYVKEKYNLPQSIEAIRHYITDAINYHSSDKEIILENVKLAKGKQKAADINRIERKSFREYARVENAIEELGKAMLEQNKQFGKALNKINIKPCKRTGDGGVGVIHITDVHANELINLPHNKYDFKVFAKRLKKHITESLRYFEFHGVSKTLIVLGGDLLNSSRRLDELLNASTNRSKAAVLAIHVFKQAIMEVRSKYPVDIVSVVGNESRVEKEMTFSNEALSDNYDFTIVAQLKQIFEASKIKGIRFLGHDKVREVVDFGKQKWLISHNISGTVDNQQKTQSEIGMYSLAGVKIDFSIGGHIHATRITDFSARSASMAGSNSYNENALGLLGRATHNCFVVKGTSRYIQVNDLQDVSDIKGYNIISKLEAYNAKSNQKLKGTGNLLVVQSIVI